MRISSFRKTAANKLRSRTGETITETLVSVLISALALVMLAGAITAASNIIKRSRNALSNYYAANEVMAEMPDSTDAANIVLTNNAKLWISPSTPGVVVGTFSLNVNKYTNTALIGREVTEYKLAQ